MGLSSAGARCVFGTTPASQRQRLSPLKAMCMQGQCCSKCALEFSIQFGEGRDCMSEKRASCNPSLSVQVCTISHHFPHHFHLALCAFIRAEPPQFCFLCWRLSLEWLITTTFVSTCSYCSTFATAVLSSSPFTADLLLNGIIFLTGLDCLQRCHQPTSTRLSAALAGCWAPHFVVRQCGSGVR
jgi:hypothetical protein